MEGLEGPGSFALIMSVMLSHLSRLSDDCS